MIWYIGIVVVFIGALLAGAFVIENVTRPGWCKRLHAMERGRAEQRDGR